MTYLADQWLADCECVAFSVLYRFSGYYLIVVSGALYPILGLSVASSRLVELNGHMEWGGPH